MTYTHKIFCSDSITLDQFDELEQFVAEAEYSTDPAAVNMGWREPAGFLYNIKNSLRWRSDQGMIVLVKDGPRPIAVSAVEYPENVTEWGIGGVRTWITPTYRSQQIANYFLNLHYQYIEARRGSFMLLTFNDYNRAAWSAVSLSPKYRRAANWSSWWDDCYALPAQIVIRHTPQWCVIKPVCCKNNDLNAKELLAWSAQINT